MQDEVLRIQLSRAIETSFDCLSEKSKHIVLKFIFENHLDIFVNTLQFRDVSVIERTDNLGSGDVINDTEQIVEIEG